MHKSDKSIRGTFLLAVRLILVFATLMLHLPRCPWSVLANADAGQTVICACCAAKVKSAKPVPVTDQLPSPPKPLPPIDCPCHVCSPGFVPLGSPPPTTVVVLTTSEFVPVSSFQAPGDVLRARLDRPPRNSS
jgi:hypothetical protein